MSVLFFFDSADTIDTAETVDKTVADTIDTAETVDKTLGMNFVNIFRFL